MLFIQSLALFAGLAVATDIQAWTNSDCNGNAGRILNVKTGGSCLSVDGRNSFEATGDNVKGYYYSGANCQGASTAFTANDNTCTQIKANGVVRSLCVVGARNSGCGY